MKLYRDATSCNELSNDEGPSSPVPESASFFLRSTYMNDRFNSSLLCLEDRDQN